MWLHLRIRHNVGTTGGVQTQADMTTPHQTGRWEVYGGMNHPGTGWYHLLAASYSQSLQGRRGVAQWRLGGWKENIPKKRGRLWKQWHSSTLTTILNTNPSRPELQTAVTTLSTPWRRPLP